MVVDKAIMFFIHLSSGFLPLESPLSVRCNIVCQFRDSSCYICSCFPELFLTHVVTLATRNYIFYFCARIQL